MPAVSVGLAEVEGRLQAIRRRVNSLTVQHVTYLTGTVAALAGAVIVVVALRGAPGLFGIGLPCLVGAMGAAITYGGLRIHREWLSLDATARLADRRAALDDRLATLLANRLDGTTPPLAPLLLDQLLAASPRWDVRTLAPRRIARSLPLFVFSIAVLIATSFYARPPMPANRLGAGQTPHAAAADEQSLFQPSGHDGQLAAQLTAGSAGGSLPGQLDASATNATGAATNAPSADPATSSHNAGRGADDGIHTDAPHGDAAGGVNEQLRQAIRHALGADDGTSTETSGEHGKSPNPGSGADQHGTQRGDRAGADEPHHRVDAPTGNEHPEASNGAGRGGSLAAAAGGTRGDEGLLANSATGRSERAGTPALGIKLSAFNAVAPSQFDPQRQSPPVGAVTGAARARGPLPELTDEQVPDAPLHKADVAPQHETIVQRIFTHDE